MSSISEILENWDLSELVGNFREHGIETNHFKDLTDEILKELCPKISTRIYLKNKINEYLTAESKTSSVPSCSQNLEGSSISELESEIDDNTLLDFITTRPPFPDFDLKTLLSTSPCGNSILNFYTNNRGLTPKHRNQLTDIIIRKLFTRIINHRINNEEYNILTSKIIALFPSENAGTYFVPPVKKRDSISGKPIFAKGKLVDKTRNILYKSGERKRKLSDDENNIQHTKPKISKNLEELKDTHKDDVVWLKINTEPWEDVIKKWKNTYELRQLTEYKTVGELIGEWSILNDVRSDVLLNLDFDAKYPNRANKLHLLWDTFIRKIQEIKSSKVRQDEKITNLIEYINGIADDDDKLPSQLKLLCLLVSPKGRVSKREKFSTAECIENFIVNVKKPGDIQTKIDDITKDASERKKTVQPYIIQCRSEGEDNTDTFYLVVDKVRYVFKSAIKAFDTLFKSYHALNLSYPKPAYHLYLLIQKCIYDIDTKYDVIPPYILELVSQAKC